MIIKHTDAGGHRYLIAMSQEEYAVMGACLDYGKYIVDGAPDADATQAELSTLVRTMHSMWDTMNRWDDG